MKQYKVIQGYYASIAEEIIEIPDDMVFLCDPNDIGSRQTIGHSHFLGITLDKSFKEGNFFGDGIIFKIYANIKPIDRLPMISVEEAEKRFHFSDYYIYHYTNGYFKDLNFECFVNSILNKEKLENSYVGERLFSCKKILRLNSAYNITVCDIGVNSWCPSSDIEVKTITKEKIELRNIFNTFQGYSVITKDPTLFNKSFNNVLESCNIGFGIYDNILAECYEKEDEFWKDICEDITADETINELKTGE